MKQLYSGLLLSALSFFIVLSCTSEHDDELEIKSKEIKKPAFIPRRGLSKGIVHDAVGIRAHPGQNYALYLPTGETKEKKCPLIIALDPHAKGKIPLEKYKSIAEERGIILAGSNYSKNGMDISSALSHIRYLIEDIQAGHAVDSSRIWVIGFSGGARMALSAGLDDCGIKAVGACGAAATLSSAQRLKTLPFIGVVGDEDMNFPELYQLHQALKALQSDQVLLQFSGKHAWPPVEIIQDVFTWFQLQYFRQQNKPPERYFLQHTFAKDDSMAQVLTDRYKLCLHLDKMISFYRGFLDITKYLKKKRQLETENSVVEKKKHIEQIIERETRTEQQLINAFVNANGKWWQKKLQQLNMRAANHKDSLERKSARRIIAYLGLAAYSYSSKALRTNQLAMAEKFLGIYRQVEPENPEHAYLFALLHCRQNQMQAAISDLNKAVEMGFTDKQRLLNEPALKPLHYTKGFEDIVTGIEKRKHSQTK